MLEVTIVGSIAARSNIPMRSVSRPRKSAGRLALVGGAVIVALVFGRLADRRRKRLFLATLAVYMAATVATAFSTDFACSRSVG